MRLTLLILLILAVTPTLSPGETAVQSELRGEWVVPAWPEGSEPRFPKRAFCWTSAEAVPNKVVAYRTTVRLAIPHDFLAVRIISPAQVYLFVDGKELYGSDRRKNEHIAVERKEFAPGEHVIVVAASSGGFALSGGFVATGESSYVRLTPVYSNSTWRVKKLPPTAVLELEPIWRAVVESPGWCPVQERSGEGLSWEAGHQGMAVLRAEIQGLLRDLDETEWRFSLIARKGITLVDSIAYYGWGPDRVNRVALTGAKEALARIPELRKAVANLVKAGEIDYTHLLWNRGRLWPVASRVCQLKQLVEAVTALLYVDDEITSLLNCAQLLTQNDGDFRSDLDKVRMTFQSAEQSLAQRDYEPAERKAEASMTLIRQLRTRMEEAWGHPLNRYNESRFSMMGWIPNADLVGGDLADWGLHVGEIEAPPVLSLPRRWRFQLDTGNGGISLGWHTIGFNIEGQWPTIDVPGTWESGYKDANPDAAAQNPYRDKIAVSREGRYNGFA